VLGEGRAARLTLVVRVPAVAGEAAPLFWIRSASACHVPALARVAPASDLPAAAGNTSSGNATTQPEANATAGNRTTQPAVAEECHVAGYEVDVNVSCTCADANACGQWAGELVVGPGCGGGAADVFLPFFLLLPWLEPNVSVASGLPAPVRALCLSWAVRWTGNQSLAAELAFVTSAAGGWQLAPLRAPAGAYWGQGELGAAEAAPPGCDDLVACTQRWWARAATDRCDSAGEAVVLAYEFLAQHRLYPNLTSEVRVSFVFPAQDWCVLELGLAPPTSALLALAGNGSAQEEAARLDAAGAAPNTTTTSAVQLYYHSDGSLAWPCFLALVADQHYAPLQGLLLLRYALALHAGPAVVATTVVDHPAANWTGEHGLLICPEAWVAAPPGATDVTVVVVLEATFGLAGRRRRLEEEAEGGGVEASVYSAWRGRVARGPASGSGLAPGGLPTGAEPAAGRPRPPLPLWPPLLALAALCLCAVAACRQCDWCFRCYKSTVLGLPWASPTAEEALLLEEVQPPCARCRELGECRCDPREWGLDPWYERREFLPTLTSSWS